MAPKILTRTDLRERGIDLNASTLWRKARAGTFPKPVRIGNRNGWLDTEINEYVQGLIAERDAVAR